LNEEGSRGNVVPRAKAICWDDGATQPVSGASPTLFRNPTMPAMAGQRCWQNLCIYKSMITHMAHLLLLRSVCLPPVNIVGVRAGSRSWKNTLVSLCKGGREKCIGRTAVRSSSVCVVEIAVARQYRRCAVWMSAARKWTGQIKKYIVRNMSLNRRGAVEEHTGRRR
jgi:hypothetical protein